MLLVTALLLTAPPPEPAYLAIFAGQTDPYKPQKTHTFATVLRGSQAKTISWLTATMKVRGLAVRPEAGTNWSLADTLAWCGENGMGVSVWGPYPVSEEFCAKFDSAACRLESGLIRYKSLDALRPNHQAMNCVHAVQSVALDRMKPVGTFGYGEPATRETVDLVARGCCRGMPGPKCCRSSAWTPPA